MDKQNFYDTINAAVLDFEENGYRSQQQLDLWLMKIKQAAKDSLVPDSVLQSMLEFTMRRIFAMQIDRGGIVKFHRNIPTYRLEMVKPKLRAELDRRILAAAQLIKLNREEMINRTLSRFSGWATSIPIGGSAAVDRMEVKAHIKKSLKQLPFTERRVLIDQGFKFRAALSEILAHDGGAIAGEWHSRWRVHGYNYRPDHKERDDQVYVVRGNWALQKGLIKLAGHEYVDDITRPGEEVFCQCSYRFIYNLRDMPQDMLTDKGKIVLKEAMAA